MMKAANAHDVRLLRVLGWSIHLVREAAETRWW